VTSRKNRERTRERRLCERWATDPDHNGIEAARHAGFRGSNAALKVAACRVLKRPSAQAYIAELTREATVAAAGERRDAIASIKECLERLTSFSRARLADYVDEDGSVRFDRLETAPEGLVRRYKRTTSTIETEKATITREESALELESSLAATVRLLEHHRGVATPQGTSATAFLEALGILPTDLLRLVMERLRAARTIDVTPQPARLEG
jgi:phage terminase small subunit